MNEWNINIFPLQASLKSPLTPGGAAWDPNSWFAKLCDILNPVSCLPGEKQEPLCHGMTSTDTRWPKSQFQLLPNDLEQTWFNTVSLYLWEW